MGTTRRWIVVAAAGAVAALIAAQAFTGGGITPARADNQCAAKCTAELGQCMKDTHNSYDCGNKRLQCLKTCG